MIGRDVHGKLAIREKGFNSLRCLVNSCKQIDEPQSETQISRIFSSRMWILGSV